MVLQRLYLKKARWDLFIRVRSLVGVGLALAMGACGGGSPSAPYVAPVPTVSAVNVSPSTASVTLGQNQPFSATVTGTGGYDSTVSWSVSGVKGGNYTHGTITDVGLYTAPNSTPSADTITVAATSNSDPTKSAGSTIILRVGTPGPGPALSVDVSQSRHTISPDIYGMNDYGLDKEVWERFATEIRLPVRRWGGDATTRYNYLYDISNAGADWYFESFPSSDSDAKTNSQFNQLVEQDVRTGTRTMGTVPLIGWTTKTPPTPPANFCGFSVSKYGAQEKTDPYDPDCGNGVKPDGKTYITGNDPADTSTRTDYNFVHDWVQYLVGRYGNAASGGVAIYSLDNEPMLWFGTHRDIHPDPTSYDEMRDATYLYARAVKDADPTAETSGPVVFSWRAYFYSAKDWVSGWNTGPYYTYDGNPVDRNAHGGIPFLDWYLQQMRAYEEQNGVRILDYLDAHGYILPDGLSFQPAGDAILQVLRLESTRALWDPNYKVDSGEIHDSVRLIPRLHDWVNNNYPGTKTAITEYNWGALDHINGALAQADVLGIFGREALDLATLWGPPNPTDPGAFAFRMYRNYDGSGGSFGDVSVSAISADQGRLALYAAQRTSDGALTLMIINKTGTDLTSNVALANFTALGAAKVYQYGAANWTAIVPQPDLSIGLNGFTATFPAWSITLVVVPSA
jgi:hypothetical protein